MIRTPAVAGHFYSSSSSLLTQQVEGFIDPGQKKVDAIGVLSPHAGLVYSGRVAGAVYSRITVPEVFVILGPNHTGLGAEVALMSRGTWEMPGGPMQVDEALASAIMGECPLAEDDQLAHLREHSVEVQIPFIQYLSRDVSFVPIVLMSGRYETLRTVGEALAAAIKKSGRKVTIVASSDMSHYEPVDEAGKKDRMALARILALDPEGLYRTVKEKRITMCGYGPAVVMLTAAKALGAVCAQEIMYMTSGDISGDYSSVVGYAGVVVR